ncbi:MAG: epoxyqueuosine reductase [Thermoanaerobacteraceae bacterium]|nr:epoxyqueuosine reductase [Thermoanaerobacteraceae bacterium]
MEEEIKQIMLSMGASLVGFSYVGDLGYEEFQGFDYAISYAVRMVDGVMDSVKDGPTHTYYHLYRTVNALIDDIGLKTSIYLEEKGFKAIPIPASQSVGELKAAFPHKTAATRAGLGWIGKNCLLVTEEYGPRVRLGTIITNAELMVGEPVNQSECGKCDICVRNCPSQSLKNTLWTVGMEREEIVDAKGCSEYMKKNYQKIGYGHVCGICISACPKGEKRKRLQSPFMI